METKITFDDKEEKAYGEIVGNYWEDYEFKSIPIGDVVPSGKKAIENKRIKWSVDDDGNPVISNDLKNSLFDGRIHIQTENGVEAYDWYGILIENQVEELMFDDEFPKKTFESLIFTLEMMGAHVMFTSSPEETLELIKKIHDYEISGGKFVPPVHREPRPYTLYESQVYLLSGLYKCKYKTAVKLLDEFETPDKVFEGLKAVEIGHTKKTNKEKLLEPFIKGIGVKFVSKNQKILTVKGDPNEEREKKE